MIVRLVGMEADRSSEMLGLVVIVCGMSIIWLVVGLLLGAWLF